MTRLNSLLIKKRVSFNQTRKSNVISKKENKFVKFRLIFLAGEEIFLHIVHDSSDHESKMHDIGVDVKWRINIFAKPLANVFWLDSHGAKVPWSKNRDKTARFFAGELQWKDRQLISLEISNITSDDLGEFTLFADNGHLQRQLVLPVRVPGRQKSSGDDPFW